MSRRLVNHRAGRPAGPASPSTAAHDPPAYEPPSCPLSDSASRALGELSKDRGTASYDTALKNALRHLGSSVGDMHERLRAQRDRLAKQRATREAKGTDKTADEERLEAHLAEFEKEVQALTEQSEQAVRGVIDKRAALEDEATVLADLYTSSATENPDSAPPGAVGPYREQREKKLAEYEQLTMRQRYALNNDYAGFKKLWHDAAVGDDGPPLPDASKWFRSDGRPVMAVAGGSGGGGTAGSVDGDMDDDDDIEVAREHVSLKCPLTLRYMDEPYSNQKCKHTFERAAILDYLPAREKVQCPQTGCSEHFTRADFDKDFYLDQAMLRRIRRHKENETRAEEDSDDEDIGDESVMALNAHRRRHSSRPVKKERM